MKTFVSKANLSSSYRTIRKHISDNFIEFSQSTVFPGFKYIGDRNISMWDRSFFLVSFLVILIYVITFTTNIYEKWMSTPVIVSMNPRPILINALPFPTVTICNVNQASAKKVRNFSRTSVEYSMLQTLCSRSVHNVDPKILTNFRNRSMFQNFIRENAQACDKLIISCKFGSIVQNCTDIFNPVFTDEGQCCVFNSVHSSFISTKNKQFRDLIRNDGALGVDWGIEKGYATTLPRSYYPKVAPGTGVSMGLSVVLNAEYEDYYCSSTSGAGFKLLLHNPIETPFLRENGLLIEAGAEMNFRIAADRSEATQNIRSFSIEKRQCVFGSERNLRNFKAYTRHNCAIECLANMTAKLCGCIGYYLPETLPNVSVCNLKHLGCQQPIRLGTYKSNFNKNFKACKELCIQGCFDLSYTPARFTIPLTSGGYFIENRMLQKYNTTYMKKNIAVVNFYYKTSHFEGFIRTQYIGGTEFLSNTGGLIGLLGLSIVSMAEFLYFWVIKPLKVFYKWIVHIYRKKKSLSEPEYSFKRVTCNDNNNFRMTLSFAQNQIKF